MGAPCYRIIPAGQPPRRSCHLERGRRRRPASGSRRSRPCSREPTLARCWRITRCCATRSRPTCGDSHFKWNTCVPFEPGLRREANPQRPATDVPSNPHRMCTGWRTTFGSAGVKTAAASATQRALLRREITDLFFRGGGRAPQGGFGRHAEHWPLRSRCNVASWLVGARHFSDDRKLSHTGTIKRRVSVTRLFQRVLIVNQVDNCPLAPGPPASPASYMSEQAASMENDQLGIFLRSLETSSIEPVLAAILHLFHQPRSRSTTDGVVLRRVVARLDGEGAVDRVDDDAGVRDAGVACSLHGSDQVRASREGRSSCHGANSASVPAGTGTRNRPSCGLKGPMAP